MQCKNGLRGNGEDLFEGREETAVRLGGELGGERKVMRSPKTIWNVLNLPCLWGNLFDFFQTILRG